MPDKAKYLFVALPASITPSGHKDDAIAAIQRAIKPENGHVQQLNVPAEFKVGTLDALLQQSEELAKIESICKGVVAKVSDTLRNVLEGDEEKIAMHKSVNDKPLEQYLKTFNWNKVKYRADKPISELMDLLQKVNQLWSVTRDSQLTRATGSQQHRQRCPDKIQSIRLPTHPVPEPFQETDRQPLHQISRQHRQSRHARFRLRTPRNPPCGCAQLLRQRLYEIL